ncbi:MAG: TetR/AcrR family transcriptional regulator [Peptococcaceae bacterium]|nr:TetR/AcrR family transcriptional regulator [Peptococcaceae bacterium]
MAEMNSEMKKREILRLSNKESNKLTRECIEAALILLMAEKDYSKITISEIVKRAGVSRTAYYRNYESKDDILNTLLRFLIADIIKAMTQFSYVTEQKMYWKTLFVTIKAHAGSFCVLLKAGFGQIILEEITRQMTAGIKEENTKDRYDMIFWSGAVCNVLTNWIQDGMKQTEEEMVEICLYVTGYFDHA